MQVADNLPIPSQRRVVGTDHRNFLQALGRHPGLKVTARATFDAAPRKRNGLDTS